MPGTDGALALGMLHVIQREGLDDRDYIARHTTGVDALRESVAPWTPEATAGATGLAADDVVALAREYATTHPACIRHGVGMQRAAGAGMALRAILLDRTATQDLKFRGNAGERPGEGRRPRRTYSLAIRLS